MSDGRIIQSTEVRNFRDFGGWRTANGNRIARGRLYRSGHWASASKASHDYLRQNSIEVLVDLRRPLERKNQPNILPDDMGIEVIESDGGDMEEPPHVKFLRGGNLTQDSVRLYMHGAYRRIPTEDYHQKLFRKALLSLSEGKTVLIHCAAGKDRTGILAALILGILEVPKDLIFQDYMLTNKAVDIDELLPEIAKRISEQFKQEIDPPVLFPMLGVEVGFLTEAYKVIGDPRKYALEQLGLLPKDLVRLKTSLLD